MCKLKTIVYACGMYKSFFSAKRGWESIDLVFGALEAIIIQINKGKEYGLKSKRVGKNLGFFSVGLVLVAEM